MGRVRDPIFWITAFLASFVLTLGVFESVQWIDRPFSGFLLLGNRVVASAGLARWPAIAELYQKELIAVDGKPLLSAADLQPQIESRPVGSSVSYTFREGSTDLSRQIDTRRFDRIDFTLLFVAYIVNGLFFFGAALLIRYLRPSDAMAQGTFAFLASLGAFSSTATDLYGPYRIFRAHAAAETFLFAGTLHMALTFPHPIQAVRRHPGLLWLPYGVSALLALLNQALLMDPAGYRWTHHTAETLFGLGLTALIVRLVATFLWPESFEARQRVRIVVVGAVAALTPFVLLTLFSALLGGRAPQNLMAMTGFLFPLSIAYATLRHNLLEVDELIRRSLNYAVLSIAVTLAYVSVVSGFEVVSKGAFEGSRALFSVIFGAASVLVVLPLRDRLQTLIDRLFFRAVYDYRRLMEVSSKRLASVVEVAVLARELGTAVSEAMHPESVTLFVRRSPDAPLEPVHVDDRLEVNLPQGRDVETAVADTAHPVDLDGRALAVPFRVGEQLIAVLHLGSPRSGRFFSGDDRRLLHTLSNQAAVAIQNALTLEQLRELNRVLEAKVVERTRELSGALSELKRTQGQLVHREKMASLGQFVAGIAHELNNPLNFIMGNFHYLQEYVRTLVDALKSYKAKAQVSPEISRELEGVAENMGLDVIFQDLGSIFEGCAEGIDRAALLVRDLRTFSRLDAGELSALDIHGALDSTLNLIRSRLPRERVVKEYGDVPSVLCRGGQVNQVFMNLLANAADAIGSSGTVVIRTRLVAGDRAQVEIEDDGCGIAPEVLDRIFDPFFTTKEVGKGMGLGLSICHEILAAHGGSIQVRSVVSRGTCFTVELPLSPRERSPDAVPEAQT